MEDMTGKGQLWEFAHTFSISQIKEIVRHLVHMHKVCLTSGEDHQELWRGKFNDSQCVMSTFVKMNETYEPFLKFCGDKGSFIG